MPRTSVLAIILTLVGVALFSAHSASAQCAVPNTLANGSTADASQVMANFNAVTGCVNSLPAGSTNALQYNGGPGALGAVGPLTNGQLPIGSTGAAPFAATLTPGVGIAITNGPGSITIATSGTPSAGPGGSPQGRLTLTSTTPVLSADVTGATTVYYDCYVGAGIPYYTGSVDVWGSITGCELSTALKASGTGVLNGADVFDIFYNGTTICVATNGTGAGWSGDTGGSITARGTGYSKVHNTRGYYTNAAALGHCYNGATRLATIPSDQGSYLGSLFTTAAGQTSMQFSPAAATGGTNNILGLWNAYNRVNYITRESDSTSCYNISNTTWGEYGGSANDRISYLDGLAQSAPAATVNSNVYINTSTTNDAFLSISLNSITNVGLSPYAHMNTWNTSINESVSAGWPPSIGLNYIQAMAYTVGWTSGYCPQLSLLVANIPM